MRASASSYAGPVQTGILRLHRDTIKVIQELTFVTCDCIDLFLVDCTYSRTHPPAPATVLALPTLLLVLTDARHCLASQQLPTSWHKYFFPLYPIREKLVLTVI